MKFLKQNILMIIGILIGGIVGYVYWQQVGCHSGTCVITSKPINSILYGAIMGGLLLSIFKPEQQKQKYNIEAISYLY